MQPEATVDAERAAKLRRTVAAFPGPWLLGLRQAPNALDRVLALVGDEPAAVFWCCEAGEAVLYRHLHTLNMAQIPAWAMSRLARASRRSSAALSTCRVIAIATPASPKQGRKRIANPAPSRAEPRLQAFGIITQYKSDSSAHGMQSNLDDFKAR